MGTENEKEMANFVKILQKNPSVNISTFRLPCGRHTAPGSETLEHLIAAHFPACTEVNKTRYQHVHKPLEDIEGKYNWINADLVRRALAKFEAKKSLGPDGRPQTRDLSAPAP